MTGREAAKWSAKPPRMKGKTVAKVSYKPGEEHQQDDEMTLVFTDGTVVEIGSVSVASTGALTFARWKKPRPTVLRPEGAA